MNDSLEVGRVGIQERVEVDPASLVDPESGEGEAGLGAAVGVVVLDLARFNEAVLLAVEQLE